MIEIEEAIDRVSTGAERKSHLMSTREKELTAYHKSGHAVVSRFLPLHDPVHKITIIPRGLRTGYTRFLPEEDRPVYDSWSISGLQRRCAWGLRGGK
jgi:cell division protease FtsH